MNIPAKSASRRRFNARIGKFRTEVGILQFMASRLLEHGMIGVQSGPDGQAFVASGGLNVGAAERRDIEDLAIGHAVERTSASHRQVFARDSAVKLIQ